MPRTSVFRKSFSYFPSRRHSNSPKPVERPSNVGQKSLQIKKTNITPLPVCETPKIWRRKESVVDSSVVNNSTSDKNSDLFKNKILTDVLIVDDLGRPKPAKAWVTVSN
jgi:hypothetical protein